jgi:glycosyltransferase involved in cell wall biosynthesis
MMKRPGLSVALCTRNGEPYLEEQLRSIAAQTRAPDELVACDDASTDGTLRILDAYARSSPFPVRIYSNAVNAGSNKNFEKAISLCEGDIVALADQDDSWLPGKTAAIMDAFSRNPSAGIVFSDALLTDERLEPLGVTLWDRVEFTRTRKRRFDRGEAWRVLLEKNMVTGATMAFRRSHAGPCMPFPSSWVHDAWIAFIVSLCADAVRVDAPLVLYRQHPRQQIGARARASLTREAVFGDNVGSYENEFRHYSDALRRLRRLRGTVLGYDEKARAVRDKVVYYFLRSRLPKEKRRRLAPVAANLCSLRYQRYGNGVLSAAKDLLLN